MELGGVEDRESVIGMFWNQFSILAKSINKKTNKKNKQTNKKQYRKCIAIVTKEAGCTEHRPELISIIYFP